jgi:putative addiction module CopG family antidote
VSGENDGKVLSVPVPKGLEEFIKKRVADAGFQTVSEYVRALVRADQERAREEELESRLVEALESGRFNEAGPELFERLRTRVPKKTRRS